MSKRTHSTLRWAQQQIGTALERRTQGEVLRIEPWDPHAAWALDLPVQAFSARITAHEDGTARPINGRIIVEVDARARLRFLRSANDDSARSEHPTAVSARELLADKRPYAASPGPRVHAPRGDGT